jgi:phosphopantetheinyl transferase
MPLFYRKRINEHTQLAVWKIVEPEDFFLQKVTLHKEITHPNKRLQHLAGRYLLQILEPHFPLHSLTLNTSGKPVLIDNSYNFSISHTADLAAAIISTKHSVGIDVEYIRLRIEKIEHKFLGENELNLLRNNVFAEHRIKWLTLFWCSKEAMFKWYGKGEVDFKENMIIGHLKESGDGGELQTTFQKVDTESLVPEFLFFGDLCLVWLVK